MTAQGSGNTSNGTEDKGAETGGTALFIIDIQKDLAEIEKTKIPHAERVKSATAQILASARKILFSQPAKNNDVIVFVQHEETPDRGPLQRGSREWELVFEPSEEGLGDGREILVGKNTRKVFPPYLPALSTSRDLFSFGWQQLITELTTLNWTTRW